MADMLGMSLDDVIDNMDHLNGRWLLMQSFSNIGHNIIMIFKSIGEAWKEVFPPVTADNLFGLLAGFYKLTTSMKITDEEADKLKRAFKGLFAVLDLVSTLVGGGLRLALKVTSYILSLFNLSLLDVAANLGDALVKFRDWIKGNNLITKAFKTMAPYLKEFVSLIVEGIVAIKDWVVANEKITQGFKKILSYLREAGSGFKAWIEGAREAENIPVYIIQGLVNGLKNGISIVASIAIELAKSIIQTVCGVLGIHSPSTEFYAIGQYIIGVKDLGNLGTQMENFADSICKFDQKLKDHGGIDKNLVEQAGYAGETMAKLQKGLYGTGGLKQGILGEKDLSDFGSQMEGFADGVVSFDQKLKDHGGIDKSLVEQAGYAGETMATLQSKIQSQNGALQDIFGEQDLEDFGSQMEGFADGVVKFDQKLKDHGGIDSDLVDQASYTHAYCPVRVGDCVRLNYSRAGLENVKAKVISQSITCESGCPVSEKAVFTTNLWR